MVDAREVSLLIADFTGRTVVRPTSTDRVEGARSRGAEQAETLALPGAVHDRVLRTQQADVASGRRRRPDGGSGDRPRDAIGLLELVVPRIPSPQEVADIGGAAHALAYVLIAARRHTDTCEWGMRSSPFSLAAVPGRERTARPVRHRPGRW